MNHQYPNYFNSAPINGQAPFTELRWRCYNRTGGATVVGGVYMLDMTRSQSEATTLNWGDAASVWRNIVTIGVNTTGTGSAQVPTLVTGIYCVATSIAADNAELEMVFASPSISVLTVAAVATVWYPIWSGLSAPAAVAPNATIGAGNGLYNRQIGRLLTGVQDADIATGVLRTCQFYGFGMN